MLYEFKRQGLAPIPDVSYYQALVRIDEGDNIHLKGTALRLKAMDRHLEGGETEEILSYLYKSRRYLTEAGDRVQLGKTIAEIARIELSKGRRFEAQQQALTAWQVLGEYAEFFFPDDLRNFVEPDRHLTRPAFSQGGSILKFCEMIDTLLPVENQEQIYTSIVLATNKFFGAERGGFFWFPEGKQPLNPELRAACNLTQTEVSSQSFKPYMDLITAAFMKKKPLLQRFHDSLRTGTQPKAVFCLPIEDQGQIRGILYHDNSYLEDCFDFLDPESLPVLFEHFNKLVHRIRNYCRLKEEKTDLVSQVSLSDENSFAKKLICKSTPMLELLKKADRAAQSESTILILGNSGVGKELLAQRIHSASPRARRPFVIVDATTIHEGLFESEMFGHEKGSFTGADRRKCGRLELANRGTLFIDEVGELPAHIQAKLLRVIQDRSFNRVGGNKTIHSDFRLIVATNRNLQKEVEVGNFRLDLYHRLSVIPLQIPPLKSRTGDIPLLANYFLKLFAKKHNRTDLFLNEDSITHLCSYSWPGNVRELQNVIERAALLSPENKLEIAPSEASLLEDDTIFSNIITLDEVQRRYIRHILKKTKGRVSGPGGAAELLGVARSTLNARMKKLGLK
jgi:transcriptional regulator with GAF, ATPase, and Fis domain